MKAKEQVLPIYARATIFFIGLLALFTVLYIAQGIIIPIVFAAIIAIVINPLVNFLVRFKINRVLAIILIITFTFILIAAFGTFLFSQASRFSESWPVLVERFTETLNQSITWISGHYDLKPQKIHEWVTRTKLELISTSSAEIGQTLVNLGSGLAVIFLVPVYIFLILFYQPLLLDFIRKLSGTDNQIQLSEIFTQIKTLIQRYIRGLLFEAIIVFALYVAGLLIIGIDYAILLAFIAAMLNIIPYIGGLIAVSLIMIIAIATKNTITYPVLVLILSLVIHVVDNSFIIPKIVASKVKINALVSITVVIAANALLGIPGMIICIPLTGIIKLIFDHIEPLKPWGFLLGDTMPDLLKLKTVRLWRFKKKKI